MLSDFGDKPHNGRDIRVNRDLEHPGVAGEGVTEEER